MRQVAWVLAVTVAVAGCGGDNPPNDSAGGASGTGGGSAGGSSGGTSSGGNGGSGGTGTSGGSPATLGAISIHILSPDSCSLEEQFQNYPEIGSERPVTATNKVQLLEDRGASSAQSVACTWRAVDTRYFVSAAISIRAPGFESRFVSWSSILAEGAVNTSNITFASPPDFPAQYGGQGTCMFSVIELDPTARNVWGSFSCGTLTDMDMTDTCALGPSYFALENCDLPD